MNCPLPIDWLDYLEGREVQVDADLDAHLAGCRRCQALVAALKERSVGRMLAPYQGAPLSLAPKWPKSTKEEASAGQIWLTLESGTEYASLSRQLVLVLGARPEFGTTWFSVAPLTTETELATSTDLLLGPKDTTLVVPLSVHFRLQAPLAREQLRAYVGETTESGRALIGEASRGTLIQEHFGSAVVRNGDTRLRRLKPMRESIAMLGSVYDAALMTAEEEAEELADADQPSARADLVTASKQGQILIFQLKRVAAPPPSKLALAAQSTTLKNRFVTSFAGESERASFRVRLELQHPMQASEVLVLFVEHFSSSGHLGLMRAALRKPNGQLLQSSAFDPTSDEPVIVASGGVGILPSQIEELEMLVVES